MDPITDEQRANREALGFEVWALRRAQEQLTEWDRAGISARPWDHPLLVGILDSFLVHARALIYFFYPATTAHPDDLLPQHLFADGGACWTHRRDTMPARVDTWRHNINVALQHLSRRRPRPVIDWDEIAIRQHFDALFAEFNLLGPIGGPIDAVHPDGSRS
jgi:hypothetical protein